MGVTLTGVILLLSLPAVASAQPSAPTVEWIELLRDPWLRSGVQVATRTNYPPDLRAQARERWEQKLPSTVRASWEFIEIAELQDFSDNPDNPTVADGRITYSSRDGAKRLEADTATGVIRYVMDTQGEWRHGCNLSAAQDGVEPRFCRGKAWNWPHLLLSQSIRDPLRPAQPLRLSEYGPLVFSFRAELVSCEIGRPNPCPAGSWGEQEVGNHCLFYVAFVLKPQSPPAADMQGGSGRCIYALYPAFCSWDGKTHSSPDPWLGGDPAGDAVYWTPNPTGLTIGRQSHVTVDVRSLIREAVSEISRRYQTDLRTEDYAIDEVLMGWEIWGPFRSDLRVRDLSFVAQGREQASSGGGVSRRQTEVSIHEDAFTINGHPTYEGRTWQGHRIEGLLMNSRMVQGIFDDLNPETVERWAYPDTGKWDPERNCREFVAAMPQWRQNGLLCFTINLQGGSPEGYSQEQPWHNSAFTPEGGLRPEYMGRLERILDRADELGMVAILGLFYFGQDQRLKDEAAVILALDNAVDWVLQRGYRNVLIEVNNECNVRYDHAILRPERVHELIERVKSHTRDGRRLPASTSYGGGTIPRENVVTAADFLLLHGNGVSEPQRLAEMVHKTRQVAGYRPMPILVNEDDHFDFDRPLCNMTAAIGQYCSWGFFDPGKNNYRDGYQSVPTNWGINTARKQAFFARLREVAGE